MRALAICAALALVVLSGCAQDQNSGPAASDKKTGTDWLYEELMAKILNDEIGDARSGSNHKKGDLNPYREGIRGYAHKALTACLVWDYVKPEVTYRTWRISGHRDWSAAEYWALKGCTEKKKQRQLNCTCQTIDHDDENVLEVPPAFLAEYEKRFSAGAQN